MTIEEQTQAQAQDSTQAQAQDSTQALALTDTGLAVTNPIPFDVSAYPGVAELLEELDGVASTAPYLADPREGVSAIARALAAYFRTPE